jgi:hypothetical protein
LSASTNVTPFNSANGSFIDWIFSSSVMGPPVLFEAIPQEAWRTQVNQAMTSEVMAQS